MLPSSLLEDLNDAGCDLTRSDVDPDMVVTPDDALSRGLDTSYGSDEPTGPWVAARLQPRERGDTSFRGRVGPRPKTRYAVRALDEYLECPFKYFAKRVLRLGDEPTDEGGAEPLRRGLFLHGVFEAFFRVWQAEGHRAITVSTFDEAVSRFRGIAEAELRKLPSFDRAVMRSWVLGSIAAASLGERLLLWEVGRPAELVERLLETRFDGNTSSTERMVPVPWNCEGLRTESICSRTPRFDSSTTSPIGRRIASGRCSCRYMRPALGKS